MYRVAIKCTICKGFNQSVDDLVVHVEKHFKVSFFMCEICYSYKANDSTNLHDHIRLKHGAKPYKFMCPLCKDFKDSSVQRVAEHLLSKSCPNVQKMYFCKLCFFYGNSVEQLIQHIFTKHFPSLSVFEYCPEECGYMSSQSKDIYQHMRDKHGLEYCSEDCENHVEISCNLCKDYVCQRADTWRRHMQNKHPYFSYSCPFKQCSYRSAVFWQLSDHIKSHLKIRHWYYECSMCSFGFKNQRSLKQHLNDKHQIQDYCSICNRYWDGLVYHLHSDHDLIFSIDKCSLCNHEFDNDLMKDDDDGSDDDSDSLDFTHLEGKHNIYFLEEWEKIE